MSWVSVADQGRLGRMRRGPSPRPEPTSQGGGSSIASADNVPASGTEPPLTPRQVEFLRLRAEGMTVNEIADETHVTPNRVANALNDAFIRLGVSSSSGRSAAIDAFRKLGWLRVPA